MKLGTDNKKREFFSLYVFLLCVLCGVSTSKNSTKVY